MSKSLRRLLLDGLPSDLDPLSVIPNLQDFVNGAAPQQLPPEFNDLGLATFGILAMAAVEKFSAERKLVDGTIENLRWRALNLYISALSASSFWAGQADIMMQLANSKPDLSNWLDVVHMERCTDLQTKKLLAAQDVLNLFRDIDGQLKRKGKLGRPSAANNSLSPVAKLRNIIDSEILVECLKSLPAKDKNDVEMMRASVRPMVREYIRRGVMHPKLGIGDKDNLDAHTKRIFRRLDDWIKSGRYQPLMKLEFMSAAEQQA